jgi:hypothetical protein
VEFLGGEQRRNHGNDKIFINGRPVSADLDKERFKNHSDNFVEATMKRKMFKGTPLMLLLPIMLLVAGCSGGGSGGSGASAAGEVAGLAVADKVSVVDAKEGGPEASGFLSALRTLSALAREGVPAGSDYMTDKTNIYVNEKAGEAFKSVNQILCMVGQTKYSDSALINKGFYKAMINSGVCQGNDDAANSGSSAQGDTSASNAPSYDIWTVKSERADANSPQYLTAYVHMSKGGPQNQPMTVHARVAITEAASANNSLGIFTINYKGFMDAAPSVVIFKGILKTERDNSGNVVIKFAEKEFGGPGGSVSRNVMAAYVKDDAAKTGHGSAYQYENYGQVHEGSIDFAYNNLFFKRVDPVSGQGPCLDRSRFETSAWRYGLYDAASGSRATLNGGFPINTKQDGSGYYGYLGYYGLNLPPDAPSLNDNSSVYKKVWENGSETTTPYTIFIRGGKLKKHTRSVITLNDIKNIPLEGGIPAPGSVSPDNTMYRVSWDGSEFAIRASATMNPNGPPAWQDVNPATAIDSSTVLPFSNLSLYSQSLGGQVNIQFSGCQPVNPNNPGAGYTCSTPTAETQVIFYKENSVYPSDPIPATLACYDNCPKAASSAGIDGSSQQGMTYQISFDPNVDNRHDYTFADMVLTDGATGFKALLSTAPAGQSWGFNSGPLFEATPDNLALLACDWNTNQTCGWKAWNALSEFYTWETGPNSWNHFSAARDGQGNFIKFDPPLQVAYIHSQSDPTAYDYKYNGSKFFLQYSGFGDLQGIPGKCINPASGGTVTDCSSPGLRWVPEFTIPADSTVTSGSDTYLVKPLEVEQRMKQSPGSCTNLSPVNMSGSMPDLAGDWVDPSLPAEPNVTDAPRVIGGVIQ